MVSGDEGELRDIRISIVTHVLIAILTGWVSFQLQITFRTMVSVIFGLGILFILGHIVERFVGKKNVKWWLSNGAVVYLFIWIISWTFFFNLA